MADARAWLRQQRDPRISRPAQRRQSVQKTLPSGFSREDLKPQGYDKFVIHPDSYFKGAYEALIIICVLFTSIIEPIKVAYQTDVPRRARF